MPDENNLFLRSLKSETDGRSGKINILNNLTPKRPQDGLTLEELKKKKPCHLTAQATAKAQVEMI